MTGFYSIFILLAIFFLISLVKIMKLEKDVRKLSRIINHLLKKEKNS